MTNKIFKAAKPDPRILIIQIITVSILSFSFGNWAAMFLILFLKTIPVYITLLILMTHTDE